MLQPDLLLTAILCFLLGFVVFSDALKRKIYNVNIVLLAVVALGYRFTLPAPMWLAATLYALLVLLVGLLLWQRAYVGAGDVKLAVVCVWVVFPHWGEFVLLSALGAGVLGVWQLAWMRLTSSYDGQRSIPLGIAIAASTVYLLF
ncbi:prepilin peptidase [Vibrio navarrensis]|uniref:prepilin peptidase n=1 Tax=Vibrio navarrensis TaxID=29495 RepID=UPI001868266B|nr:prepilin peptidase [Vibrio navarrensis]MBE3651096.1 prepilin peptidase [Vibrio navarrensis]